MSHPFWPQLTLNLNHDPLRHINKLESEGGQEEVRGYVNAKKALQVGVVISRVMRLTPPGTQPLNCEPANVLAMSGKRHSTRGW